MKKSPNKLFIEFDLEDDLEKMIFQRLYKINKYKRNYLIIKAIEKVFEDENKEKKLLDIIERLSYNTMNGRTTVESCSLPQSIMKQSPKKELVKEDFKIDLPQKKSENEIGTKSLLLSIMSSKTEDL